MSRHRAELDEVQKKYLRGLAHALKPVVFIGGAGLTPAVVAETERALEHHELIKVRARVGERGQRDLAFQELCQRTGAVAVQRIGNVVTLYRANPRAPRLTLPHVRRCSAPPDTDPTD